MTVDLYPYESPDGTEMLTAWLAPLAAPASCSSEKPNGAPLPFIRVSRTGGTDDGVTDKGKYAINVYSEDEATGQEFARHVKRRALLLCPLFGGQNPVTISTGTFYADKILYETPKPLGYVDDSIPRSMYLHQSICEMWLRIAFAT